MNRRFGSLAIQAVALLMLSASVAFAQALDDTETKRRERQLQIEATIRKAAAEADARRALETGETLTYEQVLADPDNLDLNFRYAKAQVARGELAGASATLERLLMINPTLGPIRLFYAVVLYRLGNLEEAQREFERVREMELPPAQHKEVDQYLAAIRRQQRRTVLAASVSTGWGYDTNRNSASRTKKRLFADALIDNTGTSKVRRDTNALVVTSFDVVHNLGPGPRSNQLTGSFDYYLGEQTRVDDLDLQSFSVDGGAVLRTPWFDVVPTAFASYIYLSRESYLRSQGAKLMGTRPIGTRASVALTGTWTHEDYLPITENTAAPERSGPKVNLDFVGRYILTPTMQLEFDLGYEGKDTSESFTKYNAYEGFTVGGGHTWLLGKGQFLLSALNYTDKTYDAPDPAIASAQLRRDQELRARFTYGLPVGLVVGRLLPSVMLENLTAAMTFEQLRTLSNLANYDYSNTKFSVIFTKQFEF